MTEHKFTDEEVIRALECLLSSNDIDIYDGCSFSDDCADCLEKALHAALDLINRQKAEIEVIKETTAEIRYEAINEFAERLKTYYRNLNGTTAAALVEYHIDQVLKEFINNG